MSDPEVIKFSSNFSSYGTIGEVKFMDGSPVDDVYLQKVNHLIQVACDNDPGEALEYYQD